MAIAQTITNDVADMIYDLEINGATEFRTAAVRRKIAEAKRANIAEGEMLEGMLHAVLGDYARANEFHSSAISKRPGDLVLLINHGISLKKLGDFSRAYEIFKKCCELDPSAEMATQHLISTVVVSGKLSEAIPLVNRYVKLAGSSSLHEEIELFENLVENLKATGIEEKDFQRFTTKAEELMRKHAVAARQYGSAVMVFEGEPYLLLDLDVPLGGRQLAKLNDEFSAAVVEDEHLDHCWDKLIINFGNSFGMDAAPAGACK